MHHRATRASFLAPLLLLGALSGTVRAGPQDAAALVEQLSSQRDAADPALIDQLASIGTREALDGLLEVYGTVSSLLMQREIVLALARFDGIADCEQEALQKIADVATSAPEPELHMAAVDALGGCPSMGKHFLKLIVDSPAETAIRLRAMERHIELSDGSEDDLLWYEGIFVAPEREAKEKKKKKKGAEEELRIKSISSIRELALRQVAPSFKASRLVDLAEEMERDQQEPSKATIRRIALEALVERGDRKAKTVAQDMFESNVERPENRAYAARVLYEQQGAKLVSQFVDRGTRDPSVTPLQLRIALAEMVAEMDHASTQKKLIKMIPKEKPAIVLFCIKALDGVRDDRLHAELLHQLSADDSKVRIAAAEALAGLGEEGTLEALEDRLEKEKKEAVLLALLNAISKMQPDDPDWVARLVEYAGHEQPQLRNAALSQLAGIGGYDELIFEALNSEHWSTRITALGFLEKMRTAEATGAIIARMPEESGRPLILFSEALWRLTGQPHGQRADRWVKWWADSSADFEPIDDEQLAELKEEQERRRLMQTSNARSTFFGIRVTSKRVIFILDISGSMDWELQSEYVGGRGTPRITVAKRELQRCLEQLQDDSMFNIIVFSSDVEHWLDGGIADSSISAKEEAMEFVERLGAGGGTNLFGALKQAFNDPEVDTIFVLSDGEPSVGAETDPWRIREIVAEWNEHRGVEIHTIAVGGSFSILEWLAEDSGGKHVKFD